MVAGARTADGRGSPTRAKLLRSEPCQGRGGRAGENTTIGVVATNARLTKTEATKVAQMAHDGYARAISPSHTPADGDTIFALATGGQDRQRRRRPDRRARRRGHGRRDCARRSPGDEHSRLPCRPRPAALNLYVGILLGYSLALMGIGLWVGRRVGTSADFFVAGRRLGPGLIFSTMLAANIGAGSTVGATSRGYLGGIAAWWWVGSAAIGSVVLALWIGPAMRRIAAAQNLRTVGDYLEFRYSATVRGIISTLLWIGSLFILASQLIALGWILNVVAGVPKEVGCFVGGLVITVYFAAGGLLTSARVNVVQLAVKLAGFAMALPLAIAGAGGWSGLVAVNAGDTAYWNFWRPDTPGLMYLALLVPAFVVSPGLLQKIFGARDDRAVRVGVGLNAFGLFLYAGVPAVLGIIARGRFPDLAAPDLALPMVLMHALPPVVGAIGLAAVFSAEVSAADAALFMLTTSLSQDLYKRFVRPSADDAQVLSVARWTTVASGALSVALALVSASVIDTLTIFYTLLGVTLFVPIVAGLYAPRTSSTGALASIAAGVAGMLIVQLATGGSGWTFLTPALAGLGASVGAWAISSVAREGGTPMKCKNAGMQECRNAEMQECRPRPSGTTG